MKQSVQVKEYLFAHGSITGLEALRKLGVYRLASRVHELRELGMQIETNYVVQRRKGKALRFAKYSYHSA